MNIKVIALVAACAMIATGCSAPPTPESSPAPQSPSSGATPSQEVDRDAIYTVNIDNGVELSFDADGNVVEEQQEDSCHPA